MHSRLVLIWRTQAQRGKRLVRSMHKASQAVCTVDVGTVCYAEEDEAVSLSQVTRGVTSGFGEGEVDC